MPPKKKGSAKGKKGKSSAKGKKGKSAGKKKEPVDEGPPPPPPLAWPWTQTALAWMSRAPSRKDKLRLHFRDHYLNSEQIIETQREWVRSLQIYAHPYEEDDVEAMVQMLVTLLTNEGSRKYPPDDYRLFAAALRRRHVKQHFSRMRDEFIKHTATVDTPTLIPKLLKCFQPSEMEDDHHVPRAKIEARLKQLDITLGHPPDVILEEVEADEVVANPFRVFQQFVTQNRLRLVDLFLDLDKDRSGEITKEEFIVGLQRTDVPLDKDALDDLIDHLDLDGDGMINYQEFSLGRHEAIEINRDNIRAQSVQVKEVVVERLKLTMDLDTLFTLTLHCHYTTRP